MTSITYFKPTRSNFYDLNSGEDLQNLLNSKDSVVLDIYANWCAPCRHVGPKFEALAKSHEADGKKKIAFSKINIDDLSDSQKKDFQITALPSFLYFKNGVFVEKVMSANINDVVEKVDSLLKMN